MFIEVCSGRSLVKGFPCQSRSHRRCRFDPWAEMIPWRRKWQPTPLFLPGKSHGQRSLVGYIVHRVAKSQTQMNDWACIEGLQIWWMQFWNKDERDLIQCVHDNLKSIGSMMMMFWNLDDTSSTCDFLKYQDILELRSLSKQERWG